MHYFRCLYLAVQKQRSWDTSGAGFTLSVPPAALTHCLIKSSLAGPEFTEQAVLHKYKAITGGNLASSITKLSEFFSFSLFFPAHGLLPSFPVPCPISSPPWPNPGPVWGPGGAWSLLSCVLPSFIAALYFLALCIWRGSADLKWSALAAR